MCCLKKTAVFWWRFLQWVSRGFQEERTEQAVTELPINHLMLFCALFDIRFNIHPTPIDSKSYRSVQFQVGAVV